MLGPLAAIAAEPASAASTEQPWPPDKHLHLPVNVVESSPLLKANPDLPIITIGSLPTEKIADYTATPGDVQTRNYLQSVIVHNSIGNNLLDPIERRIPFAGASANLTTFVLFTTPLTPNRSDWIPTDISLSGNTIILQIKAWDEPAFMAQAASLPPQYRLLLSLGKLPAGNYTFVLDCQHFKQDDPNVLNLPAGPFHWAGRSETASVAFTVGVQANGAAVTLAHSFLKSTLMEGPNPMGDEIEPDCWFIHHDLVQPEPQVLQVGSLNALNAIKYVRDLWQSQEHSRFPLPSLAATPNPSKEIYAVVAGAALNSGEWMTLEKIEYYPGGCRLAVGLWRDNEARSKNILSTAFLVVPLRLTADMHTVMLVWHNYTAPSSQNPYVLTDNAQDLPVSTSVQVTFANAQNNAVKADVPVVPSPAMTMSADISPVAVTRPMDLGAPSPDTVAYTIKNLGTLGGNSSVARAINATGQVVGQASDAAGELHAFLYNGDKMQDLGTLPNYAYGDANAINAAGQVVGWVGTSLEHRRAYIYSEGRMQEIGTLGGNTSEASAINATGEVVGEAQTASGQRHAFFYSGDHMQDLGTLGGDQSDAYGLNDSRQVVGSSLIGKSGPVPSFRQVPFLSDAGKIVALDALGHQISQATAINSAGQIVGFMGDLTQWSSDHAFLYSDGKLQDLGTLGGNASFSQARAINAHGQIVGMSGSHPLDNNSLDGARAFLYSGGHMQDLRKLVGEANLAAAGFKALLRATGINDRGQIVGTGIDGKGNEIAFLLTPVEKK